MPLHVVVGAGPVGAATARLLAARGDEVRLLSRRGGGPVLDGVERVAVDAAARDLPAPFGPGARSLAAVSSGWGSPSRVPSRTAAG